MKTKDWLIKAAKKAGGGTLPPRNETSRAAARRFIMEASRNCDLHKLQSILQGSCAINDRIYGKKLKIKLLRH